MPALMPAPWSPRHFKPGFGEAVCRVVGGLSLRQIRTRTGIDIDTVARMKAGEVPRMDKVIDFARGFGLPVNQWLELAGYERLDPHWGPEALSDQVDQMASEPEALTYEPDLESVVISGYQGRDIDPESLAVAERLVRSYLSEKRRRQGREP